MFTTIFFTPFAEDGNCSPIETLVFLMDELWLRCDNIYLTLLRFSVLVKIE